MNNIVVTARDNIAIVFRQSDINQCKYTKVVRGVAEDTAMTALYAIAEVLENMNPNAKECTTIIIPKFLGLLLKISAPAEVRARGYVSEYGKQLSKEYIDIMCYINELRSYLTTKVVRLTITGSSRLTREQVILIGKCWDITDTVIAPSRKKEVRAEQKTNKPVRPSFMDNKSTIKKPVRKACI